MKVSTTTYRLPMDAASALHRLAADLGFTYTRGRPSLFGVGNASALLRALAAAYQLDQAGLLAALREGGVNTDPEG